MIYYQVVVNAIKGGKERIVPYLNLTATYLCLREQVIPILLRPVESVPVQSLAIANVLRDIQENSVKMKVLLALLIWIVMDLSVWQMEFANATMGNSANNVNFR